MSRALDVPPREDSVSPPAHLMIHYDDYSPINSPHAHPYLDEANSSESDAEDGFEGSILSSPGGGPMYATALAKKSNQQVLGRLYLDHQQRSNNKPLKMGRRRLRRWENDRFLVNVPTMGRALWATQQAYPGSSGLPQHHDNIFIASTSGDEDLEHIAAARSFFADVPRGLLEAFADGAAPPDFDPSLPTRRPRRAASVEPDELLKRRVRRSIRTLLLSNSGLSFLEFIKELERYLLACRTRLPRLADEDAPADIPFTPILGVVDEAPVVKRASNGETILVEFKFRKPVHRLLAHGVAQFHALHSESRDDKVRTTTFRVKPATASGAEEEDDSVTALADYLEKVLTTSSKKA